MSLLQFSYAALIYPSLLYDAETWTMNILCEGKIDGFQM